MKIIYHLLSISQKSNLIIDRISVIDHHEIIMIFSFIKNGKILIRMRISKLIIQWIFISVVLCIFHKWILIFIVTFTLSFRMMRSWFGLELRVLFVQWEVLVFLDLAVDQSFRFVNWLQSFSFFFFCPEIYIIWYAHTKYLRFYTEQISILHICSWKSISSR